MDANDGFVLNSLDAAALTGNLVVNGGGNVRNWGKIPCLLLGMDCYLFRPFRPAHNDFLLLTVAAVRNLARANKTRFDSV